jgi:hypothetical protein
VSGDELYTPQVVYVTRGFCSIWFTGGQKDKSVTEKQVGYRVSPLQNVVTITGKLAEPSWRSVTLLSFQKAACSLQSREFKVNSRHTVNPRKIAMLAPTSKHEKLFFRFYQSCVFLFLWSEEIQGPH